MDQEKGISNGTTFLRVICIIVALINIFMAVAVLSALSDFHQDVKTYKETHAGK